ncbi:Crp/Fnr family transcriptional regulator [Roseomonas sp. WA12]
MIALDMPPPGPGDFLFRRLNGLSALTPADRALLSFVSPSTQLHHGGEELNEQGEPVREARLILSGWAGTVRVLPDGRRQIFRLMLPGDVIGRCDQPQPLALSTTQALTVLETVELEPVLAPLRADAASQSRLREALCLDAALEQAALLDHLMRLGRQTAMERTAHLLLELRHRLSAVGLAGPDRFPLPLTQETLADTLGLSTVHMNRTLQELRRARLLRLERGQVELPDPDRLAGIADYTPPRISSRMPATR